MVKNSIVFFAILKVCLIFLYLEDFYRTICLKNLLFLISWLVRKLKMLEELSTCRGVDYFFSFVSDLRKVLMWIMS